MHEVTGKCAVIARFRLRSSPLALHLLGDSRMEKFSDSTASEIPLDKIMRMISKRSGGFDGETNARLAASQTQEALDLFATPDGGHSPAKFATAQLDLVTAQLALHDLDGAGVHAQAVLQLPSEHRTVSITEHIGGWQLSTQDGQPVPGIRHRPRRHPGRRRDESS
ncbi:MAG: hypothetical protein ACRDRX_24685 [Pseudonocardiaceae bacterium]